MSNTTSTTGSSSPSAAKKALLAFGVVLALATATFAVVRATNDSSADDESIAVIESTPATEPGPAVSEAAETMTPVTATPVTATPVRVRGTLSRHQPRSPW